MDAFNPKDRAEEIALYRSRIIGPLTVRELSRGDLTKEIEALSRQLFTSPRSHSPRRYAISTLERWYYKYKSEGLEGLKSKPRSDRGRAQQLSAEQKELLINIRQEYPEASAPLILSTLEQDGRLETGSLSATTLRRFFREQGLDRVAVHNPHTRTRLRWQAERPGALWHADVCHAPALRDANDKTMEVRIHAILDDASRYIIAIEAMRQERELDMLNLMVRAIRQHGIPDALYLDNGSTYRGQALSLAATRMGTVLIHARPYDAPARGKMERFWRTLRGQCLRFAASVSTLHDLNVRLWAWVDEHYHKAPHGGLMGKSPGAVYLAAERLVDGFDETKLREALTIHARRRMRRDNTLSMDGQDWQTDLGFLAGRLVTVGRCLVDPDEPPFILHENRRYALESVDPVRNAQRPRLSAHNLDRPHPARVHFDPPTATLDHALGRNPRSNDKERES